MHLVPLATKTLKQISLIHPTQLRMCLIYFTWWCTWLMVWATVVYWKVHVFWGEKKMWQQLKKKSSFERLLREIKTLCVTQLSRLPVCGTLSCMSSHYVSFRSAVGRCSATVYQSSLAFVFCTLSLIIKILTIIYVMFYSIIMMNGTVTRAWALSWRHRWLKKKNRGAWALRQLVKKHNKLSFKRRETHQMFSSILSCTDTKTQSLTTAYNLECSCTSVVFSQAVKCS